jgi:transposase-like protein
MSNTQATEIADIYVKVIVGAQYAYACIKTDRTTLDVQLAAGRSAAQAMREFAAEQREKAQRLLRQADLVDAAADLVV